MLYQSLASPYRVYCSSLWSPRSNSWLPSFPKSIVFDPSSSHLLSSLSLFPISFSSLSIVTKRLPRWIARNFFILRFSLRYWCRSDLFWRHSSRADLVDCVLPLVWSVSPPFADRYRATGGQRWLELHQVLRSRPKLGVRIVQPLQGCLHARSDAPVRLFCTTALRKLQGIRRLAFNTLISRKVLLKAVVQADTND